MMKATRIILLLGLTFFSVQFLQAQVKIGERPLEIGNDRLLEMQSKLGELLIVTDSLEIGITTSDVTNNPNADALMLKLYGYGFGNFLPTGTSPYIQDTELLGGVSSNVFAGITDDGRLLEVPLRMVLDIKSSTSAELSINNGIDTFGTVELSQLDSLFSTNQQLTDSINTLRTLVNDNKSNDLDTIQTNELIDLITVEVGLSGEQTLLTFYEDVFGPDSTRHISQVELDPYFATNQQLADTAQALRDNMFYFVDGTIDEDRTVNGGTHSLTFTNVDSFNVSSSNTTLTTPGNTSVSSTGTTDISSDGNVTVTSNLGDVNISSTTGTTSVSGTDVTISAPADTISMIGTVTLDEYVAKPSELVFNNILGIDAAGNVINIDASTILGTETDSVIYRHNGTLTEDRYMTMATFDLHFVDGTDTTVIANDGRVAVGTGTFTPNSVGPNPSDVKLEVNGDILAVRVHSSSDERFKKNIKQIDSALDKVMKINGVTYDFRTNEFKNKNFPTTQQVGFIAQNVEKVLPEVVQTHGDGYKAVDYAKITALLNEAIKEQQHQISAQEELIKNQQNLITAILSKYEGLESQIANLKANFQDVSNQTMSEE